jgi:hypothetical protein
MRWCQVKTCSNRLRLGSFVRLRIPNRILFGGYRNAGLDYHCMKARLSRILRTNYTDGHFSEIITEASGFKLLRCPTATGALSIPAILRVKLQ